MSIRNWAFAAGVIAVAAIGGVATSQQPPPSPVAATQVDLPRSRADNAALAQARQDPLAARLRSAVSQNKGLDGLRRQIDASTVPVLAPAEMGLLDTAEFTGGDRVYMLVVQRGEQIIEIYGTTKAFQSPLTTPALQEAATGARALARARAAGLTNLRTERTEYGVDVTFSRFGAAYNVSFLCEGAPDCTEADAISFAAGLQLIGGGAA